MGISLVDGISVSGMKSTNIINPSLKTASIKQIKGNFEKDNVQNYEPGNTK